MKGHCKNRSAAKIKIFYAVSNKQRKIQEFNWLIISKQFLYAQFCGKAHLFRLFAKVRNLLTLLNYL